MQTVTITAAGQAQINFGAGVDVLGNVSNTVTYALGNNATFTTGSNSGLIAFADANSTIDGDVTLNATFGGTIGTLTDVEDNGLIVFANAATTLDITGTLKNLSSTTISSTTTPANFTNNGNILFTGLTSGVITVDGGINNSSNFSGIDDPANTYNGVIDFDNGGSRTAGSTIGTGGSRVGAVVSNSIDHTAGNGNGDILFGGDNSTGGFLEHQLVF